MSAPVIQPSFAAGELSPYLYARVDLDKFHTGAALLRNLFVDYRGGVSSRAGTRFVALAGSQDPALRVRLIQFQFSVDQTYSLELGHQYLRVLKNGGIVFSGGVPYTLPTPWQGPDIPLLKFAQSNDVVTITHPNYPPYDLARLADDNWELSPVRFGTTQDVPLIAAVVTADSTPQTPGNPTTYIKNVFYDYVATAVNADGQESAASARGWVMGYSFEQVQVTNTIILFNSPGASYYNFYRARTFVSSTALFPPQGQTYGFIGTSLGGTLSDSNITPDFARTPPANKDPFLPGQVLGVTVVSPGANYTEQATFTITDPTGSGAVIRPLVDNINRNIQGGIVVRGGVGYTNPTVVVDDPGGGTGASVGLRVGPNSGTYPSVVTYFQQRKFFAATANQPSTYWATRTGQFNNMDSSIPTMDNDALSFTLAALQQNPIKFMIPMQNGLVVLTGGAAWLVTGAGQNEALTPTSVKQTPQIYNGCADVPPLVIGYNILYVQEKGYVVQDVKYDFLTSVYTGEDRTYLASHLFEDRTIVEWAWAEQPHRIVWACTSDGKLLSLTYIPEQKVYGWAQHETQGFVESVCVIPEGREDFLYLVVRRNGVRCLERMETRQGWISMLDVWGLDAALRYVGPATGVVSNLSHMANQVASVVADGEYLGELPVGADGRLTLPRQASNILVGYGYDTEFRSMYLDIPMQPTPQGRRKTMTAMTLRLLESRGVSAGRTDGQDKVPLKDNAQGPELISDDVRVLLATAYETKGQVDVQGTRGMPWTLTAIIPEVAMGDGNG